MQLKVGWTELKVERENGTFLSSIQCVHNLIKFANISEQNYFVESLHIVAGLNFIVFRIISPVSPMSHKSQESTFDDSLFIMSLPTFDAIKRHHECPPGIVLRHLHKTSYHAHSFFSKALLSAHAQKVEVIHRQSIYI